MCKNVKLAGGCLLKQSRRNARPLTFIEDIGVARGGQRGYAPQKIFRKYRHFCALKGVFIHKIVLIA